MTRRTNTRSSVLLGAMALCLCLASPALAYEEAKGVARVEAVDTTARTITLQGSVYEVTSRSQLTGPEGERITLESLAPPPLQHGLAVMNVQPTIRFVGAIVRQKRVLISAERVEGFAH